MDWLKDPDVGPILLQISRIYTAEKSDCVFPGFSDDVFQYYSLLVYPMTIVGTVYFFRYDVHPKPKLIVHMFSFLLLGGLFYLTYMHIMALSLV